MKKALHIFTEKKFIDSHISLSLTSDYQNFYIYLSDQKDYSGVYADIVEFVHVNDLEKVILKIKHIDLLYIYYLDLIKAKIINKVSDYKIKILWHFYGAELYNQDRVKKTFLSKGTRKLLYPGYILWWRKIIKNWVKNLFLRLFPSSNPQRIIDIAVQRVDFFCWYSREEYEYLNSLFKNKLPKFLSQPLANKYENVIVNPEKRRDILIGNSKSPFNNHIDILKLIDRYNPSLSISLPFNYGSRSQYPAILVKHINKLSLNVRLLEEFVDRTSYINFINEHKAFIFNSYRQMGLGNLFIAISCGLKIYMNEFNPTYRWLINNNIKIFSVQHDLKRDIVNSEIQLNKFEIIENINSYSRLVTK